MTPDQYQSISDLYSLLARLWIREVDEELLRAIQSGPIADALKVTDELVTDDLAVEYCALFIGPKNHLPPFQSVWQDGQLQSETSDSIRAFATAIGRDDLVSETTLPDHIGVQLQIMSAITGLLAKNDDAELKNAGKEFFARHLTWPERFLNGTINRATSAFYRSLAELTKDLLQSERGYWI